MSDKAPWITYRPELRVMDCTIRDGGLINDHHFSDELVRAVYDTCVEAGIDYMEIGYKNSPRLFPTDEFGPWKHCHEEDIRRVVGDHDAEKTGLRLACMADASKSDWRQQIQPKSESVLDMIRVAFYVHQVPEAVEMICHAHEMGYEVCANLMAVSNAQEVEVDQALEEICKTPAGTVVIVDSFGALYREQIDALYTKYNRYAQPKGMDIGIHAHNNLQLGFANTIEAIILGANRIDATMAGLGRGAGNCPMELLIGFLRNPKFHIRPIYKLLTDHFVALRQEIEWGPLVPYNITGQLNQHPRDAMKWRAGDTPDDYTAFFDQQTAEV